MPALGTGGAANHSANCSLPRKLCLRRQGYKHGTLPGPSTVTPVLVAARVNTNSNPMLPRTGCHVGTFTRSFSITNIAQVRRTPCRSIARSLNVAHTVKH